MKTPTTFQVAPPNFTSLPSVSPLKRTVACLPTLISRVPGVKRRPSTKVSVLRISNASGPTPRTGTLAGWLSDDRGSAMMTTSSGDASGWPSLPRATCGIASISGSWRAQHRAHRLGGRALAQQDGVLVRAAGDERAVKPCAIAIVITKTATTIAMPMAVIAAVPLRTVIERRL